MTQFYQSCRVVDAGSYLATLARKDTANDASRRGEALYCPSELLVANPTYVDLPCFCSQEGHMLV